MRTRGKAAEKEMVDRFLREKGPSMYDENCGVDVGVQHDLELLGGSRQVSTPKIGILTIIVGSTIYRFEIWRHKFHSDIAVKGYGRKCH